MKKNILNVLSALLGLMLINAGLNKFFNYMPVPKDLPEAMVKDFAAIMEISWLLPLVGFAEVLGGLLILLPRTRALGALVLFPVMVGILLTNLLVERSGLPIAIAIWVIFIWIIFDNKRKYLPLLSK
ncbi:DoxX family protein [Desertivirga arenae]|uniref:DoxX family protein n=1 Tax=Desertivirga arenae TaxID=2810309 RepID=UPI001A97B032|nr:DoxX family protein [Pedobacter sp. SYSU D00823]